MDKEREVGMARKMKGLKMEAEVALAAAEARMAEGMCEGYAAASVGVSVGTLRRWRERAAKGLELRDYSGSGRRRMVEVDERDGDILRAYVLRANLGERRVSVSGGVRLAAMDPDSGLSAAVREAILAPRADASDLPVAVREAVAEVAAPGVVGRYRDSRDGINNGLYMPGYLRSPEDEIGRRFAPLERVSWDDGSTNFMLWVPWPRGGDRCSDRFGVRLVRGQLLACVDSGSGMCVHYSFVVRERDSYTAGDVCAAMWEMWQRFGVPPGQVLEGGSWQAKRTLELCDRAGAKVVSAKGRSSQKLVERFFGSLWTVHAGLMPEGHIGRFRGEAWQESKDVVACRAGARDPRRLFPSVFDFLAGLDKAIGIVNRSEVASRMYGKWVPAERFAAEEPVGKRVPEGLERLALPVVAERTVRRGGMVQVRAVNGAGVDWEYAFGVAEGHRWEGARVSVAFDPRYPERGADVRLAGDQARFGRDWELVDGAAVSMGPAPVLEEAGGAWGLRWFDSREEARGAKRSARAAVLTAVRGADERGKMGKRNGQNGQNGDQGDGVERDGCGLGETRPTGIDRGQVKEIFVKGGGVEESAEELMTLFS